MKFRVDMQNRADATLQAQEEMHKRADSLMTSRRARRAICAQSSGRCRINTAFRRFGRSADEWRLAPPVDRTTGHCTGAIQNARASWGATGFVVATVVRLVDWP